VLGQQGFVTPKGMNFGLSKDKDVVKECIIK
jgi:hypothetical protein